MIGHIPEMVEAGIASAKIEGRMKTIFTRRQSSVSIGKRSTAIMRIPHRIGFARMAGRIVEGQQSSLYHRFFPWADLMSAQNYESSAYIRSTTLSESSGRMTAKPAAR